MILVFGGSKQSEGRTQKEWSHSFFVIPCPSSQPLKKGGQSFEEWANSVVGSWSSTSRTSSILLCLFPMKLEPFPCSLSISPCLRGTKSLIIDPSYPIHFILLYAISHAFTCTPKDDGGPSIYQCHYEDEDWTHWTNRQAMTSFFPALSRKYLHHLSALLV